jgi:nicotinamide mononucleotide (NMN) deamidase PncC
MNRGHSEEVNGANSVATPSGSSGDGGSKRKRVSLACNACRLRKSKVRTRHCVRRRCWQRRRLRIAP